MITGLDPMKDLQNSANEMPKVRSEAVSKAEERPIFQPHVAFFSLQKLSIHCRSLETVVWQCGS